MSFLFEGRILLDPWIPGFDSTTSPLPFLTLGWVGFSQALMSSLRHLSLCIHSVLITTLEWAVHFRSPPLKWLTLPEVSRRRVGKIKVSRQRRSSLTRRRSGGIPFSGNEASCKWWRLSYSLKDRHITTINEKVRKKRGHLCGAQGQEWL